VVSCMSRVAVSGNPSGAGTITIQSANTNSDYTLTLPAATGSVVVTGGAQTIEFAAGAVGTPSITFTGDTNTGIFSPAADTVAISAGGTNKAQFGTGSATIDGLTVGRGAGAVATNTAVGASALAANTTGDQNIAVGGNALLSNTTGLANVAVGLNSLRTNITGQQNTALGHQVLYANTGDYNTGAGTNTLRFNTSGANNTAFGYNSLFSNTTASNNTAVGYQAAYATTTGLDITAVGYNAYRNGTASYQTAIGFNAMGSATVTGTQSVAVGRFALGALTSGNNNVAVGDSSLGANTSGSNNVAIGRDALVANTTASNNTAVGYQAGYSSTTGFANTFVGYQAGYSTNRTDGASGRNVFVGEAAGYANTTGRWNSYFGHYAGSDITTGNGNTIIGRFGGNSGGLDIRTSSNYIVLSDGDGNPRYNIDNKGNLQNALAMSNSLLRQVSRGSGNATETFTSTDMGMTDNVTALINISVGGTTTFFAYGGTLIYWYMPRGSNSAVQTSIVTAFKGSAVTTFSISASGNSLVVSKDSGLAVSITVIGGGGISII
jgi:hypothetical protein